MKRIFIVGCHRSGTTLMRLILDSHPLIYCFEEGRSYRSILEDNYENPKKITDILGFKLPNWTEFLLTKHRDLYKNDLILFMLRDVRGAVASMATLHIPKPDNPDNKWINNAVNAVKNKWKEQPERGCSPEFFEEVDRTDNQSEPTLRKAALYWRHKTSRYIEMVKVGWPVLPVYYENLVLHPESCLKVIFNFLEIEWHNDILNHHTKEHSETAGNGYTIGRTLVTRPIDAKSLYKWKEIFSIEQETAILESAGELNDYFNLKFY